MTCSCGLPIEVCSDPDAKIYSYRRICRGTMEREAADAHYKALHGDKSAFQYHDGTFSHWSGKRTAETPYAYDEGVTIGVDTVDRAPWDKFTTKADASPWPPSKPDDESPEEVG